MTLSAGAYLLGALELAVIVGALAFAAWRVARLILPGWSGAPARLVEIVLGVVGFLWLSEALGTFGLFEDAPMLIGAVAIAAAAWFAGRDAAPRGRGALRPRRRAGPPGSAPRSPAPRSPRPGWSRPSRRSPAAWTAPTRSGTTCRSRRGSSSPATSARSTTSTRSSSPPTTRRTRRSSTRPAILAFGRDILSPLLNLGFLAIGLLASYCIGRPYGVGPHSLLGGAIALGSQQLVEFQAGEALNDITGVAFVLAAVAVLVNGSPQPGR